MLNITKKVTTTDRIDLSLVLENLKMSQRQFAKIAKIDYTHFNKICNGLSCTEKTALKIFNTINKLTTPNNG